MCYIGEIAESNVTRTVGQDVQLSCPNASNAKFQGIRWWKGQNRIIFNGNVLSKFKDRISFDAATGMLIIHNPSLEDSGVYYCGDGFSTLSEVYLYVLGKFIYLFT